ncbi:hypothetical protein GCM10007096_29820 [Pullulanibacillus pueri]|uniref:Uncharacterized protein n=2 Tax=Pullulanibacillus pueri TaxID=1437324 RepID=A0A8J2ZXF0_9BACL|nr:hypothetical protein GCM10007096_29820 [Pullulanibacillus pueri]
MGEMHRRIQRLLSEKPIGKVTPIGDNGYGKDEAGRIFMLESAEATERKRAVGHRKRDKRHFTFSHMRNMHEVTDNLSNKLCGYILMLQPYIHFKTNIIGIQGRNPMPLDDKGIAKIFGIHVKHTRTALSKLKDADVLEQTDSGYYRINDRYHFRKKAGGDAAMLVKTFHTTLKTLKLSAAEAGFLYKLTPFVHYETNLICENPFEEVAQDVRYMNKTQIAKCVGISRQKVEEVLRRLKKAGALVTVERRAMLLENSDDGDGRDTLVILNPRIFSRLQGENGYDNTILQMFAGL